MITDMRRFFPIGSCVECDRPARWVVSEFTDRDGELFEFEEVWVLTCDEHKMTEIT